MAESNIEYFLGKVESGEDLTDVEKDVLRLLEIYGELSADGTEAYFERRWSEFREDMFVLKKHRLDDLVECFEKYRLCVFGCQAIDASEAWDILESLIEAGPSSIVEAIDIEIIDKIELIYLKASKLVVLEK